MFVDVELGTVCEVFSSKRIFASEYTAEGVPFYRGKEVIEKALNSCVSTPLFISEERFEEIKNKFGTPQLNDVLLTSVGTIGIPWLVDEERFYFKDGNVSCLRANQEKLLPEYLYYWLNSGSAKKQIDAFQIGSTQKALTLETIKKFNIPSEEFALRLLYEEKVACVPGSAFGTGGEGYIRISYCYSEQELKEALERIEKFIFKIQSK